MTDTTQASPAFDEQHDSANYLPIFLTLCGLTLVSVGADFIPFSGLRFLIILIAMSVAIAKAMYVILYFMRVKFEGGWKYLLLAPTVSMAILLPTSLYPDISTEYYPNDPNLQFSDEATRAEKPLSSHSTH